MPPVKKTPEQLLRQMHARLGIVERRLAAVLLRVPQPSPCPEFGQGYRKSVRQLARLCRDLLDATYDHTPSAPIRAALSLVLDRVNRSHRMADDPHSPRST